MNLLCATGGRLITCRVADAVLHEAMEAPAPASARSIQE